MLVQEAEQAASTTGPTQTVDPSQIAPFGAIKRTTDRFKRKTKSYSYARDEEKTMNDPDKHPWVLTDYEEAHTYTGALQGASSSSFALFVFAVGFSL